MKLSLSWIFDHIIGSWKEHDIPSLIDTFNKTTAEIEQFKHIHLDLSNYFLARVVQFDDKQAVVFCPELATELKLPFRDDLQENNTYVIKKDLKTIRWATLTDWYSQKEGFISAVSCSEDNLTGSWKDAFEPEDYIIEIDNKSITNRPDLWGHRGIAREIAAILNLPFISAEMLLASLPVREYESFASATSSIPFSIELTNTEKCKRFAGLYMPLVGFQPSWIWMAYRLACVDSRPINAIVDTTNYVMFDWSQPIHAFDANTITTKKIEPRLAKYHEKLTLLDNETIELTDQDLVITDSQKPIALAGVMGGKDTAVSTNTQALFVESASFDATTIRKTAMRVKKRTEASARFEKSLDPMQNTQALLRFLKLLENEKIPLVVADHVISVGKEFKAPTIDIEHNFIESCIGTKIEADFIIKTLIALDFQVTQFKKDDTDVYSIVVPTFRATKDISIKTDIVEEIARFFGFSNIPLELPYMQIKSTVLSWVLKRRMIKQLAAFSLQAHEVNNYALFDDEFLNELSWKPQNTVTIANPLSELSTQLVTSLMPHLLKNIKQNQKEYDTLRFFEWNRCWEKINDAVIEKKQLAGIFFDQKKEIDFYEEKYTLSTLFDALELAIEWKKPDQVPAPWYHPHQTARLICLGNNIGYAGKIDRSFLAPLAEGDAFVFELDGQALLSLMPEAKQFEPIVKYPASFFDVSILIPLSVTIAQITENIKHADSRIKQVDLIDFFQKEEWKDKKSVTMRCLAQDPEKTLTKDDIDYIYNHVILTLKKIDAEIR
ncbi:MAG: phenylalanine--tRNA ligase subunit beta [Candidatus Babeliales bacterium]